MEYVLLVVLWGGFGVVHSFLISTGFTRWLKAKLGRYFVFYRLSYNLLSIFMLIPIVVYTKSLNSIVLINLTPPWNILTKLLAAGSAMVIILATWRFGLIEFIGLRQAINFFSRPNSKQPTPPTGLVRTGLYGIVRHPVYLAAIILVWSMSITLADVLVSIVLTIYIVIGLVLEEKKLVLEYGRDYINYQNEVPMLIPFLNLLIRLRKKIKTMVI
ncbi:MAG: NnrU protein [Pelotomaculum sp. PtaB.Bin104]|nr:MAG: NnrU protein [Pelotomaculum sp. PtaB.Bin104]